MAGKFANVADEMVYSLSLDGCDEEHGSVQWGRWAGLVRFSNDDAASLQAVAELPFRPVGAIITEDSVGFVDVRYFATEELLGAIWADDTEPTDADADDEVYV